MTPFKERMLQSAREKQSRLVLALDIAGPIETRLARARVLLDQTKQEVAAVKLNQHLLLPYGLRGVEGLVADCKKTRLPIIADLKLNDIESTNLDALESLISSGIDGLIANPFVGYKEGLGRVLGRARESGTGVLLLAYMSHEGAKEGYGVLTDRGEPLYRVFATRAREWGADGVVVSARSNGIIDEVRGIIGNDCLIFSPGVGPQGGAASVVRSSAADFVIVGRSVTEAPAPAESAAALRRELSS